ncbi:MAG: SDR family oxidoreductase [Flavobacteriaceae bacterium]
MEFKNKNVLITGASKGIGKATALEFAKRGAKVGINYKQDDSAAEKTLAELGTAKHRLYKADIADEKEAQKLVDDFVADFGTIDILVNNAGIAELHDIASISYPAWQQAWKKIIDTNLMAAANLCFCATQYMIKSEGGRIVNVSSRGAFRGEPGMPAYGASKAALNSLSQSLAKALAPHKIYVGVVAPGFTETDMATATLTESERESLIKESPLGRMARPEEVAYAILFLASEGSEYTTGIILDVNGASYLR